MKKIWVSLLLVGVMLLGGGLAVPTYAVGDICEDGNGISDELKEAAGANWTPTRVQCRLWCI